MNLIRMTIFHLKRLLKMPMILFMMIGMPALVNGIMIASQGAVDTKVPSTVAKTVAFVFEEGNDEYQELIAPYSRRKCVFRLRQCQRGFEKRRNDGHLPSASQLFTEGERRPSADDSHLEYAARNERFSA